MKKSKIGLAVAGAVALAVAGIDAGHAAGPGVAGEFASLRTLPRDADAGSRIVIKYRSGSASAHDVGSRLSTVRSAADRAIPAAQRAVANGRAAPLRSLDTRHLRTLAVGADVIGLSRDLGRDEMKRLLAELRATPGVEYAEVDRRAYPLLAPNDARYMSHQWNLHDPAGGIRASEAWDVSTGKGVVVAVLDTGVLPDNPDLGANLLQGYDFISDTQVSRRPTDDRVPGALDLGDWNDDANECQVGDSSWHGTHVAGTVAQVADNGIGVAGVAFDAKVLPVRVLGRCGGYNSDIADAIVWASGGTVDGVPANDHPAEVINLSLGGSGACNAIYQNAIDTAVANGSVVVVAAGNDGDDARRYSPASCRNVVTVGATRITGGKASYSNYGTTVDLAAPGGGGGGDDPGNDGWDGYIAQFAYDGKTTPDSGDWVLLGYAGTSMAAPHVAGVAALVQSARVGAGLDPLSPTDMETLLKSSARSFPAAIPSATPLGAGIVDAKAALDAALAEPCDPAVGACGPQAVELVNKVSVQGLRSGDQPTLYRFEAKAGAVLTFTSFRGSGNASLYARFGEAPTETVFDARSMRPGNNEIIRFTAPSAGTYYLLVTGSYTGMALVARQ